MGKYLIVGVPGVGKTTVLAELDRRGYNVIDADIEPHLTGWISKETGNLVAEWSDNQRSAPEGCTWGWDRVAIERITQDSSRDPLFLGGNVAGMELFYPLFANVFALTADDETIRRRLTDPSRVNPHNYGAKPEHIAEALGMNTVFSEQELSRGSILIDASGPVSSVADNIESYINEHKKNQ